MTACKGHAKGEHKYQKFDDVSLFCERCGDRMVIVPAPYVPLPTYVPVVPYYPWPPNTWSPPPYLPWTIISTTSRDTATTTVWNDTTQLTFTNAVAGPQTATPRGVRQ